MYQLFFDTDCEIRYTFAKEYNLGVVKMPYVVEDEEFYYDLGEHTDFKSFFDKERAGIMPTTCALNVNDYLEIFEPVLAGGTDVLMICFSSALSGTHVMLEQARVQLLEKYPDRYFRTVDTLSISGGGGQLVYHAAKMYKAGKSADEIAQWVLDNRMKVHHWFSVDDLNHLKRGGRLSSAAAFMGTVLEVKPVITVNSEGKLIVHEKVKGRRRAIKTLLEKLDMYYTDSPDQLIEVLHADAPEDAEYLAGLVREKYPLAELWVDYVGPVIGAHCGPGLIALVFMGKDRVQ